MGRNFSQLCEIEDEALVTLLLQKIETTLAEETIKKQLEKDVSTNEEQTTFSKLLMDPIINKDNGNYSSDESVDLLPFEILVNQQTYLLRDVEEIVRH